MNHEWHFWVYIMASKSRCIYTGMTNDIERRVKEHKAGLIEGFAQKYRIDRLVYLEKFHYVNNAIHREKQIKGLDRAKRVALIESMNSAWEDLSEEWGKALEPIHLRAAEEQQIPRGLKLARDDNSLNGEKLASKSMSEGAPFRGSENVRVEEPELAASN